MAVQSGGARCRSPTYARFGVAECTVAALEAKESTARTSHQKEKKKRR
jgi:hypothetical protein